jgi:hypothetical protein
MCAEISQFGESLCRMENSDNRPWGAIWGPGGSIKHRTSSLWKLHFLDLIQYSTGGLLTPISGRCGYNRISTVR